MAESNDVVGVELRAVVDQFTGQLKDALGTAVSGIANFGKAVEETHSNTVNATKEMASHFGLVGEAVEALHGTLGGLLALMAGGAVFREFVQEANEAAGAIGKLNRIYGLSSEQTETLNLATKMVGSSTEAMTSGMNRLARQLVSNEADINRLGVATRDSEHHFLDTITILSNAGIALGNYGAGMGRLEAATRMFGRNIELINAVMKMTPEVMAEAKRFSEDLNYSIGMEGVKAARDYAEAMAKSSTVVERSGEMLGGAITPALTAMSEQFNKLGPGIINIVKILADAVAFLATGIVQLGTVVVGTFTAIGMELLTLNQAVVDLMHGEGKKALEDFLIGETAVGARTREMWEDLKKQGQSYLDVHNQLWNGQKPLEKPEGGKPPPPKKDRVAEWDRELRVMEAASGEFYKDQTSHEMEFWQDKLRIANLSTKEEQEIDIKVFESKKKLAGQSLALIAGKNAQTIASYKDSLDGQYDAATTYYAMIAQLYGTDDMRSQKAMDKVIEINTKMNEQRIQFKTDDINNEVEHQNSLLEIQRMGFSQQEKLGQITGAEKVQLEAQLDQEIYAEKRSALQQEYDLNLGRVDQQRKILTQMQKLENEHVKGVAKSQNDMILAVKQKWANFLSPITSAFDASITGMIMGTQTWQKALSNIFTSVVGEFVNMAVKLGVEWLTTHIAMAAVSTATAASKTAVDTAAAVTGATVGSTEARLNLAAFAAEGAVAAGASVAAIPFYGWAMVPEVMGSTYAELMSMQGSIPAAAQGMVVPQDMLAMVHKEEMVLPATLSKGLQSLIQSGGSISKPMNLTPAAAEIRLPTQSNTFNIDAKGEENAIAPLLKMSDMKMPAQNNMLNVDTNAEQEPASPAPQQRAAQREQEVVSPTLFARGIQSLVDSGSDISSALGDLPKLPELKASNVFVAPPKFPELKAPSGAIALPKFPELKLPTTPNATPKSGISDVYARSASSVMPKLPELKLPTIPSTAPKNNSTSDAYARSASSVMPKFPELKLPTANNILPKSSGAIDASARSASSVVPKLPELKLPTVSSALPQSSNISDASLRSAPSLMPKIADLKMPAVSRDMLKLGNAGPQSLPAAPEPAASTGSTINEGDTHLHIHSLDSKSVQQLFMDHSSALYVAWKAHTRNMGVNVGGVRRS